MCVNVKQIVKDCVSSISSLNFPWINKKKNNYNYLQFALLALDRSESYYSMSHR